MPHSLGKHSLDRLSFVECSHVVILFDDHSWCLVILHTGIQGSPTNLWFSFQALREQYLRHAPTGDHIDMLPPPPERLVWRWVCSCNIKVGRRCTMYIYIIYIITYHKKQNRYLWWDFYSYYAYSIPYLHVLHHGQLRHRASGSGGSSQRSGDSQRGCLRGVCDAWLKPESKADKTVEEWQYSILFLVGKWWYMMIK